MAAAKHKHKDPVPALRAELNKVKKQLAGKSPVNLLAGQVVAGNIAGLAVTAGTLAVGSVDSGALQASSVTTTALAADSVTSAKIAANTITADDIATGTLTATTIAAGTITGDKIAAGTITASNIAATTITGDKIAASTITATQIAATTITSTQIQAGSINSDRLYAGSVQAQRIQTNNLAANIITATEIAANTITAGQLAANAVTTTVLAADSVTSAKIAANTIVAADIASGTITATQIASATITATNIASATITGALIAAGTVTATNIASGTITGSLIAGGTITGTLIASATIDSTKISVSSLSALSANLGTITAGTITGATFQTSTGTARVQMDSSGIFAKDTGNADTFRIDAATGNVTLKGTVTTGSSVPAGVITGTLTTSQIGDSQVTTIKIADANIIASKIQAGAITADKLSIGQPLVPVVRNGNFAEGNPADGTTVASGGVPGWTTTSGVTVSTDALMGRTLHTVDHVYAQQTVTLPVGRHVVRTWVNTASMTGGSAGLTWAAGTATATLTASATVAAGTAGWQLVEAVANVTASGTTILRLDASLGAGNKISNGSFETDTSGYTVTTTNVTNLARNPSFEVDNSIWATTGATWLNAGATLTRVVTTSAVGAASGRVVTTNASAAQGITLVLLGTFLAGTTYYARVRVKGNAGGESLSARLGANATNADQASNLFAATNAFVEKLVAWTPTADRTNANLTIRSEVAAAYTFFVDAVIVSTSATATYFDGDTATASWTGTAGLSTSTLPNASFTRSNAWSADGTWSGRFQAVSATDRLDSPSFTVVAGAKIDAQLVAHAVTVTGGNVSIDVRWSDGTSTNVATVNAAGDTTPTANNVTVPAGVTSATLRLTPSAPGTYDIYIDSVNVTDYAGDAYFANVTVDTSVSNTTLAPDSVTTDKILANTILAGDIAAATITSTQIAATTITAGNIASGTITAAQIAAGTITADRLSVTALSAITANLGTVTAGTLTGTTITGGTINTAASGDRIELSGTSLKINVSATDVVKLDPAKGLTFVGSSTAIDLSSIEWTDVASGAYIADAGAYKASGTRQAWFEVITTGATRSAAAVQAAGLNLSHDDTGNTSTATLVATHSSGLTEYKSQLEIDSGGAVTVLTGSNTSPHTTTLADTNGDMTVARDATVTRNLTVTGAISAVGGGAGLSSDRISFPVGVANFYVLNQASTGVKLVNGATAWAAQSDVRLKTDLAPIIDGLAAVMAIRPLRYRLKADPSRLRVGVVAQDVARRIPEAVDADADGMLSVRYTELVPHIIGAIQQLERRRTRALLDALVADLAAGIEPKVIAGRHRERAALEQHLDETTAR